MFGVTQRIFVEKQNNKNLKTYFKNYTTHNILEYANDDLNRYLKKIV